MTKADWDKSIWETPAVSLTGEYLVWAIDVCKWRKEQIRELMLTVPVGHLSFWKGEIEAIWNLQEKFEELLGRDYGGIR